MWPRVPSLVSTTVESFKERIGYRRARLRLFYVNGMTATAVTSLRDARLASTVLTDVTTELELDELLDGLDFHWNNTTPFEELSIVGSLFILSIIALICLIIPNRWNRRLTSAQRGSSIIIALIMMFVALSWVFTRRFAREESASEMGRKLKQYLDSNPDHRATIVSHSQGAYISGTVLQNLTADQASRVHVITLGGARTWDGCGVGGAWNVTFDNDHVATSARYMSPLLGVVDCCHAHPHASNNITAVAPAQAQQLAHDAKDYIQTEEFKMAMRECVYAHVAKWQQAVIDHQPPTTPRMQ